MDYYSKYIKYKTKYIEIKKKRGGEGLVSKNIGGPNVFIPDEMNIQIIKNLSFDEKLKFIETLAELPEPFVVDSESAIQISKYFFNKYISNICFNDSELNEIRNSGEYYALNGCLKLLKLSLLFDPKYNLNEETCAAAAYVGRLDILKWCREHGCPWDGRTSGNAAKGGHWDILKWCREQEHPCPWFSYYILNRVIEGGNLDILKWCINHGYPRGSYVEQELACSISALYGHLEILKLLRDQGYQWNEWTCARAARGGYLDILKWCREQDPPCPWDRRTCINAAKSGHRDILKWCIEQGCPCDEMIFDQVQKYYT